MKRKTQPIEMTPELIKYVEVFRSTPVFEKRKGLMSLINLFSDVMPSEFADAVREVNSNETPMAPPVTRRSNTDKILKAARKSFKKQDSEWIESIKSEFSRMTDSFPWPDYEKKRAKGTFSVFIDGIVSNFKTIPNKRRKNG